ncbi:MAG: acyltransferase [Phenylobacterium sp.]|uniref:acyltransferase family protein n=1 Tax=Phenylobacterium sp. TaxID=1871053 RepID=UPI0027349739|nr:acyltransferase [Phenylobacterium sp.]MDP1642374.1 acyltransferase [Phenylobacterium sp.]MDP3117997.1 acyltransferase [Phenylobacterium sp.]
MTDAQQIHPLTSLRFFAAFWVVLFHYWPALATGATPLFVAKGYLGVELFFVLSGFILCHVYRSQVEAGGFNYGGFLWARLARVYPLHLATLIGMGVLAAAAGAAGFAVDPNILSWEALLPNLLLVQAWGFAPVAGWNHPSWSISAEWFAYLTFPLFAWAALALKARPLVAVALAAVFMAGLYAGFEVLAGHPLTLATISWGALRIVPCFALGCALHSLWRERAGGGRSQAWLGAAISGAVALFAATLGLSDTIIVLGTAGLIFYLARLAQNGSQALSTPILIYLGEISYSIYMICVPWKIVFVNGAASLLKLESDQLPLGIWLVLLVGVIPLAALSYHLIEKPARERMKLWAGLWKGRAPKVAGA